MTSGGLSFNRWEISPIETRKVRIDVEKVRFFKVGAQEAHSIVIYKKYTMSGAAQNKG